MFVYTDAERICSCVPLKLSVRVEKTHIVRRRGVHVLFVIYDGAVYVLNGAVVGWYNNVKIYIFTRFTKHAWSMRRRRLDIFVRLNFPSERHRRHCRQEVYIYAIIYDDYKDSWMRDSVKLNFISISLILALLLVPADGMPPSESYNRFLPIYVYDWVEYFVDAMCGCM